METDAESERGCNPFFVLRLDHQTGRGRTKYNTIHPHWKETCAFLLPKREEGETIEMKIEIWDEIRGRVFRDDTERLCVGSFDLSFVVENEYSQMGQWIELETSPNTNYSLSVSEEEVIQAATLVPPSPSSSPSPSPSPSPLQSPLPFTRETENRDSCNTYSSGPYTSPSTPPFSSRFSPAPEPSSIFSLSPPTPEERIYAPSIQMQGSPLSSVKEIVPCQSSSRRTSSVPLAPSISLSSSVTDMSPVRPSTGKPGLVFFFFFFSEMHCH